MRFRCACVDTRSCDRQDAGVLYAYVYDQADSMARCVMVTAFNSGYMTVLIHTSLLRPSSARHSTVSVITCSSEGEDYCLFKSADMSGVFEN